MKLGHVHTEFMLADILIKPLGRTRFCFLRDQILHDLPKNLHVNVDGFIEDVRETT